MQGDISGVPARLRPPGIRKREAPDAPVVRADAHGRSEFLGRSGKSASGRTVRGSAAAAATAEPRRSGPARPVHTILPYVQLKGLLSREYMESDAGERQAMWADGRLKGRSGCPLCRSCGPAPLDLQQRGVRASACEGGLHKSRWFNDFVRSFPAACQRLDSVRLTASDYGRARSRPDGAATEELLRRTRMSRKRAVNCTTATVRATVIKANCQSSWKNIILT